MQAIYLAGAISEVSPEYAVGWRRAAGSYLERAGFKVFDPTSGKDLTLPGINMDYYTPEGIVEADLDAIWQSDIILAEIALKGVAYHGTSMELAYAYNWNKLVFVWGGATSYWVRYHATEIFDELTEALERIAALKALCAPVNTKEELKFGQRNTQKKGLGSLLTGRKLQCDRFRTGLELSSS